MQILGWAMVAMLFIGILAVGAKLAGDWRPMLIMAAVGIVFVAWIVLAAFLIKM